MFVSPAMIEMVVKTKLDGIITGEIPEFFILKNRTETQIDLKLKNPDEFNDIVLTKLLVSFVYKGFAITITND